MLRFRSYRRGVFPRIRAGFFRVVEFVLEKPRLAEQARMDHSHGNTRDADHPAVHSSLAADHDGEKHMSILVTQSFVPSGQVKVLRFNAV